MARSAQLCDDRDRSALGHVYVREQRKERQNDEEELYLQLSDEYAKFLRLVLENAELHLITETAPAAPLTSDQIERRNILFEILIALFEQAYILVYEENEPSGFTALANVGGLYASVVPSSGLSRAPSQSARR